MCVVCDGRQECDLIQKGFCLPRRCERTCKGNNAKKEFADQGKRDTHNEMPVKKSEREKEILSRLGMALTLFFSLITTSRHSSLSQSHSRHPTDGAKNEQLERTDGAGRAGVLFFGENGFSSPFCWGPLGSRPHSPCLVSGFIRCHIAGKESKTREAASKAMSRPLSHRQAANAKQKSGMPFTLNLWLWFLN